MTVMGDELAEHVAALRLVDHHVHGAFTADLDRAAFETHLNEGSPDPVPEWMTQFVRDGFTSATTSSPRPGPTTTATWPPREMRPSARRPGKARTAPFATPQSTPSRRTSRNPRSPAQAPPGLILRLREPPG